MDVLGILKLIEGKLTAKAFLTVSSIIMGLVGCYLVFMGIKDEGYIDIKTAVFEGHLKSGSVGILIIVASLVLAGFVALPKHDNRTITISLGGKTKITVTGVHSMRDTIDRLAPVLRTIAAKEDSGASPGKLDNDQDRPQKS